MGENVTRDGNLVDIDGSDLADQARALAKARGPGTHVRVIGNGQSLARRVQKELAPTDPQPSQVSQDIEPDVVFEQSGAIDPPYPPDALLMEFENSNALRQNVDAYAQNIDGFGWRFEPVFDLDDEDIDQQVADALFLDQRQQAVREMSNFDESFEPSPEEVNAAKAEIAKLMRRERAMLDLFFGFCCSDRSFTQLRKDARQDQEILGHAWWELRRNANGELSAFSYVPSFTVRAVNIEGDVIEREVPVKVSPLRWGTRTELHRAGRWVQVVPGSGQPIFFKEGGDDRLVSNLSGAVYEDIKAMQLDEPEATPATELVQFRIHSSRSGRYGVPRWIGNLKSVLGSRKAETVNLLYFNNKSVPPLALLVSGGSVTKETVNRLEDYVKNELHGDEANFHKILIIEAEPAGDAMDPLNSGKIRIELIPLTKAINNDALFMKYIEAGRNMIGESMRNPKIVRGATDQINRATAQASLEFAEAQVYAPERQGFDWWVNRFIMPELRVTFWEFRSNSPVATDLDAAKAITDLTKAAILTPEEARRLVSRVFNIDLKKIDAEWVKQPLQLSLAGALMDPGTEGPSNGETENAMLSGEAKAMADVIRQARKRREDPVAAVAKLFALRDEAMRRESEQASQDYAATKEIDEVLGLGEAETIHMKWPGSVDKYFTPARENDDENKAT